MPKAYWIANVDVHDEEAYKRYLVANKVAFSKYHARYVIRAGHRQVAEGSARSRIVVLEFPDYETACACYTSAEYQEAFQIRKGSSTADIVIIEGYDGPQPGHT